MQIQEELTTVGSEGQLLASAGTNVILLLTWYIIRVLFTVSLSAQSKVSCTICLTNYLSTRQWTGEVPALVELTHIL